MYTMPSQHFVSFAMNFVVYATVKNAFQFDE